MTDQNFPEKQAINLRANGFDDDEIEFILNKDFGVGSRVAKNAVLSTRGDYGCQG